jgi:hypothetical protein
LDKLHSSSWWWAMVIWPNKVWSDFIHWHHINMHNPHMGF